MIFKLTPISVAIFIAAFVNTFVAYSSWQRQKAKGGIYFAFAMLAITFWTVAAGLDYAAVPIPLKVFFAKLEYLGYMSAVALFAAFSLSYAGYEDLLKKTRFGIVLISIPISNIALAWTNEFHGWVWADFRMNESANNVLIFEHGPAFIWVTLSGYALILIIFVSLLNATLKGSELARKQARWLFLALLALVASNLLYLFDIFNTPGVDWSSITFSVTGLLFLLALYGSRFMDVIPVARNTMIERMADGVLVLDAQGHLVDFNSSAQAIFGIQHEDLWTPFQTALARWPEIIALLENTTKPESTEFTIEDKSRVFDLRLTILEDNFSQVYGLLLVIRDITDRKQAESAMRVSEERFRHLVTASPDAVFGIDAEGRIVFANHEAVRLLGYSLTELVGNNIDILVPVSLRHKHADQRREYVTNPRTRLMGSVQDLIARHKEGHEIPVDIKLSHTVTKDETLIIAIMRDITKRKLAENALQNANQQLTNQLAEIEKLQTALREQANRDSLTQLYNRRFLDETLERELLLAQRNSHPVSVALFDVDHFKPINDTYGHSIGDECLIMLAQLLRQHFRKSDIICRYGGEEFLIVLPDSSTDLSVHRIEELRQLVANMVIQHGMQEIRFTISSGIATFPTHGKNSVEIIRKADQAMYISKQTGRNRVTVWS